MPELPEMENYKRLLTPLISHRPILDTTVTREKSLNLPIYQWRERVVGQKVAAVARKAKHLLIHLTGGDVLNLHLMLGGKLFFGTEKEKPERSAQVEMKFPHGTLFFIGLRLGYLHLHRRPELDQLLSRIGPDPLYPPLSETAFRERLLMKSRSALKTVLTDQHVLAGIGNCYADEICFDAGIVPFQKIAALQGEHWSRLYRSMREVLEIAVEFGGYMDLPLYKGDLLTGGYDSRCRVYDREGEACVRCGHPIKREEISGRKMFYCPNCQGVQ